MSVNTKPTYYSGIILCANYVLCSKKCWHNVERPNIGASLIDRIVLQAISLISMASVVQTGYTTPTPWFSRLYLMGIVYTGTTTQLIIKGD